VLSAEYEKGFNIMLAPTRPPATKFKYRLLYLGDDLELIAALRKALADAHCRVVACSDHGSAILFLKSDIPYQGLLIDWEWRGRGGLELARLVQSLKHRSDLTTMLVAATKLSRYKEAVAHKAGIRECLIKTKDMAEVIKATSRLMSALKAVNRES
jgi:PleD family two-component response regulator